MKTACITLEHPGDLAPIKLFFDSNPGIDLKWLEINGSYIYVFYTEA